MGVPPYHSLIDTEMEKSPKRNQHAAENGDRRERLCYNEAEPPAVAGGAFVLPTCAGSPSVACHPVLGAKDPVFGFRLFATDGVRVAGGAFVLPTCAGSPSVACHPEPVFSSAGDAVVEGSYGCYWLFALAECRMLTASFLLPCHSP